MVIKCTMFAVRPMTNRLAWKERLMFRQLLPDQPQNVHVPAPMIYINEKTTWEYKQITRSLSKEGVLSEDDLNVLGSEGWELTGVVSYAKKATFYFKRAGK